MSSFEHVLVSKQYRGLTRQIDLRNIDRSIHHGEAASRVRPRRLLRDQAVLVLVLKALGSCAIDRHDVSMSALQSWIEGFVHMVGEALHSNHCPAFNSAFNCVTTVFWSVNHRQALSQQGKNPSCWIQLVWWLWSVPHASQPYSDASFPKVMALHSR